MGMDEQMFGKQLSAGYRDNGTQNGLISRSCQVFFVTLSRDSLQITLFFRQLQERSKHIPEPFEPWLFSAGNNLHAKETFWGSRQILFPYNSIVVDHLNKVHLTIMTSIVNNFSLTVPRVWMSFGGWSSILCCGEPADKTIPCDNFADMCLIKFSSREWDWKTMLEAYVGFCWLHLQSIIQKKMKVKNC